MEELEDIEEESEIWKVEPEPGKVCVVLEDSLEGYYIIHCEACRDFWGHKKQLENSCNPYVMAESVTAYMVQDTETAIQW